MERRSHNGKLKLIRNVLEREATGARPEDSDRDDNHKHSEGDQSEHSCNCGTDRMCQRSVWICKEQALWLVRRVILRYTLIERNNPVVPRL